MLEARTKFVLVQLDNVRRRIDVVQIEKNVLRERGVSEEFHIK